MSEAVVVPEAPAVNIDPSTNKPAPAAPAPKPDEKPPWLDDRLARERKSALKDIGFDSPEAAKKALDALKAQEQQAEAKKTIEEKNAALEQSIKDRDQKLNEANEALSAYAKSQMAALSDAQKAAVVALAGEDAAKQLKAIDALRSTWAQPAAPAAATSTETAKPADTGQGKSMPKEGGAGAPPDPGAVWAELRKTNPVLAARYAEEHGLLKF
jgi:uncharacterized protein YecT (DUF1311 family)